MKLIQNYQAARSEAVLFGYCHNLIVFIYYYVFRGIRWVDQLVTYKANIEYWSRGGMSWSTKRCQEVLKELGYDSIPAYPGRPANSLIQKVMFEGTREQVLHHRKKITDRLRIESGGRMALVFSYIKNNSK